MALNWQAFPYTEHWGFTGPRASPPTDEWQAILCYIYGWSLCILPCVLFSCWFSLWELWGYWLVHIVFLPMGLQTPSAPWVLSLVPPLGTQYMTFYLAQSLIHMGRNKHANPHPSFLTTWILFSVRSSNTPQATSETALPRSSRILLYGSLGSHPS